MNKTIGNNLPRIKVQNQYAIKELIYKFGPISRFETAERLGLTLPTITTSVSTMLKKGLLKEVENNSEIKTLGRRTMLVDINEDYAYYFGVEIRGSGRRALISNAKGETICSLSDEEHVSLYEDALKSAASLFSQLLKKASLTPSDIQCVGLTVPGLVDDVSGRLIIHPGNKWRDKPIKNDFSALTGFTGEICVENNTIARAYAMSMFEGRNLKDADSIAYMFVSIGIGCPLLSDVRSHFGYVTGEGEVGHMVMDPKGPKCVCGNHGCLEAYSSEKTIENEALVAVAKGESEVLSAILDKNGKITTDDVMEAASNGDEKARAIIDKAIGYLGLAIANIDNFVRPEYVVIEAKLFDDMENRKQLLEVIHKNLYRETMSDYRFFFRQRDDYSGAKGAAAVAIKHDLELFIE